MAAKLTILTHKIAIQLRLVAESCTIWSSRSRRSVLKLLDTPRMRANMQTCKHANMDACLCILLPPNGLPDFPMFTSYKILSIQKNQCFPVIETVNDPKQGVTTCRGSNKHRQTNIRNILSAYSLFRNVPNTFCDIND
jgi:hypothetical protein